MALPDSYLQFKEADGDVRPFEPLPKDKISNPATSIFYFISITFVIIVTLILLIGYSSARGNPFSFFANYFHTENWWGSRENIAFITDSIPTNRPIENTEFDTKVNLVYNSKAISELDKNLTLNLNIDLAGVKNIDNTAQLVTSISGSVNRDSGKYNFNIADGTLKLTSKYSGGNLYYNIFAAPSMIDLFIDNKDSRVNLGEYFSKDMKVVGQSSFYNNLIFEGDKYWETNLNAYSLSKISQNDKLYQDYGKFIKSITTLITGESIQKNSRATVFSTDDSILFHTTQSSTSYVSKKKKLLEEVIGEISDSASVAAEDYCLNSDRVIAQSCKDTILKDLTNINADSLAAIFNKMNINYFDFYVDAVSGKLNKYEFEIELPKSVAENNFENIVGDSNLTSFYLKISHTNKILLSPTKIDIQNGALLYDEFYYLLFSK